MAGCFILKLWFAVTGGFLVFVFQGSTPKSSVFFLLLFLNACTVVQYLVHLVHGYAIKLLQDVFLNNTPTVDKIVSARVSSARLN